MRILHHQHSLKSLIKLLSIPTLNNSPILIRTLDHIPEWESTEFAPEYKTLFQILTDSVDDEINAANDESELMNLHTLRTTTVTLCPNSQYKIDTIKSSGSALLYADSLSTKKKRIHAALSKMRKNHILSALLHTHHQQGLRWYVNNNSNSNSNIHVSAIVE